MKNQTATEKRIEQLNFIANAHKKPLKPTRMKIVSFKFEGAFKKENEVAYKMGVVREIENEVPGATILGWDSEIDYLLTVEVRDADYESLRCLLMNMYRVVSITH